MRDKLLQLVKRRHPLYERMAAHWHFLEATYEGGREWFAENIFQYVREGEKEFKERVKRAYRFNHTKHVVDLVDKYLFRQPIYRKESDAPDYLKAFWKKATRGGLDMTTFAKRISSATSKFGRVWIVVDSNAEPGEIVTRADELNGDVKIYAYIVRPQDMLDMAYDDDGDLLWALIAELHRDDDDPLNSSGAYSSRFRLWTRDDWSLFELQKRGGQDKVVLVDYGVHGLGAVPVIPADHVPSEEPYTSPGLIDDNAYLDRAVANYISNLDAIFQDQTFSQLAMPAQGVMPGEKGYDKLVEMGTKRVFIYNGEAGKGPEWISPDPKQAELILKAIGKLTNEIYHSVGLAGERNQDDNGGGIDNASGAAKAYDFERVNSLLAAKADALQLTEIRIARMVARWNGVGDLKNADGMVTYPREFDTRGLYDEFEIGARLLLLAAPDEVRKQQMRLVIRKLFPGASDADLKAMEDSLKDWPVDPIQQAQDMAKATGKVGLGNPNSAGGPAAAAGTQKTAKELAA